MAKHEQVGNPGANREDPLWWAEPGKLAGMPMPYVHVMRRMNGGGALGAYDDELPVLHREGIRAVVCLLNIRSDAAVYDKAGFRFLLCPIDNGAPPSVEQAFTAVRFIDECLAQELPVAVHCEGGVGRTGTVIAAWFIANGMTARDAIERVRSVHPCAVETEPQIKFLEDFESLVARKG